MNEEQYLVCTECGCWIDVNENGVIPGFYNFTMGHGKLCGKGDKYGNYNNFEWKDSTEGLDLKKKDIYYFPIEIERSSRKLRKQKIKQYLNNL
jgi:hypothetical protein